MNENSECFPCAIFSLTNCCKTLFATYFSNVVTHFLAAIKYTFSLLFVLVWLFYVCVCLGRVPLSILCDGQLHHPQSFGGTLQRGHK